MNAKRGTRTQRTPEQSRELGRVGVTHVVEMLQSPIVKLTWHETFSITDVQENPEFQDIDADLLWCYSTGTGLGCYKVEVKTDRQYLSGNFFIETISDIENGTPGCFVASKADLYIFYFIEIEVAYVVPLPEAQEWFRKTQKKFPKREKGNNSAGASRRSRGKLVPISLVLSEVPNVRIYRRDPHGVWTIISFNDIPE